MQYYVANLNGASVTPTPVNTQQSGKVTFDDDRYSYPPGIIVAEQHACHKFDL